MVTESPINAPSTVESRVRELELNVERLSRMNTNVAPTPPTDRRTLLERWFPGITIVAIAGFAFWLGMINATVNNTAARMDKVYSIILESRDSLSTRTTIIESNLGSIDKKLDEVIAQSNTRTKKR